MKKELVKLANHLDRIGLRKEADYVDALLKKEASSQSGGDLLGKIIADLKTSLESIIVDTAGPATEAISTAFIECAEEKTEIVLGWPPIKLPSEEELNQCVFEKVSSEIGNITRETFDALITSCYKELKRLYNKYMPSLPSFPVPGF